MLVVFHYLRFALYKTSIHEYMKANGSIRMSITQWSSQADYLSQIEIIGQNIIVDKAGWVNINNAIS